MPASENHYFVRNGLERLCYLRLPIPRRGRSRRMASSKVVSTERITNPPSASTRLMNCAPSIPKIRAREKAASKKRLAVILSHPVQYYAPWFQQIAKSGALELRVFYLWNPDDTTTYDRGFGVSVAWDIPLLKGYEFEFVPNISRDPGTHHFRGLINPELPSRIAVWKPDAILFFGYAWQSHLQTIFSPTLRDIPFLFRGDSHDLYPARGWKSLVSRHLRSLAFRQFEAFLSVGKSHRQYLLHSKVPGSKIFPVPHCIDNARFSSAREQACVLAKAWKTELGIASDRPVVLFVGKFEEKKRPQDLLEAFLALRPNQQAEAPALLFVGNGKLEKELRKRAGNKIGEDVFFAPFQNQTEMPKVYATGDLLALPSFGRGETWGLVVNEAMNLETAALVSSHVGCGADLVIENETGWTFEAGNQDHLRVQLAKATSDPEELAKVGKAAAQHIENFSYEVATQRLLSALGSLAKK